MSEISKEPKIDTGLSSLEATERLKKYGENVLDETKDWEKEFDEEWQDDLEYAGTVDIRTAKDFIKDLANTVLDEIVKTRGNEIGHHRFENIDEKMLVKIKELRKHFS